MKYRGIIIEKDAYSGEYSAIIDYDTITASTLKGIKNEILDVMHHHPPGTKFTTRTRQELLAIHRQQKMNEVNLV